MIRSLSALTDPTGEYVTDIVLSSNIETFTAVPDDGGAAAWFVWSGAMRCVAIDLYRRPSDNFIAVSRVIKALERTMARGGFQAVNQALQAFTPPPSNMEMVGLTWHDVLGVAENASRDDIHTAYRRRATTAHSDRGGGSRLAWDELTRAYDQAKSETPDAPDDVATSADSDDEWGWANLMDDDALWDGSDILLPATDHPPADGVAGSHHAD